MNAEHAKVLADIKTTLTVRKLELIEIYRGTSRKVRAAVWLLLEHCDGSFIEDIKGGRR